MIKSIEEGRREDGNRSIADKIIKRLHDLEKTVQNNHGRWAWELLQNAKDSVAETDRKVSVRINYCYDEIEFLHNGNHFTERDIRGLINQISSKEVDEGETSARTGRFGTGFLTTHLLSKEVIIKGVVETVEGDLFQFGFPLNRNGKTTAALIPNIENAWKEFHSSTDGSKIKQYNSEEFNTSFTYVLESDQQKDIAKIGVCEFINLIPYVLSFIPEIYQVEICDTTAESEVIFINDLQSENNFKKITKIENGRTSIVRLLYATNGKVSIAARTVKRGDNFEVLNLEKIPKLFCDFPLIGTENFYFPVVVNSFNFNPQTERDGVWLMGDNDAEVLENKEILQQALALYKDLINKIENKPFTSIFNIAKSKMPSTDEKYFDIVWYRDFIQKPLRKFLLEKSIVDLVDNNKGKLGELWFPSNIYSKETKAKLWQYTYDLFPTLVCKRINLHSWIEIVWDDISKITYNDLIKDLADIGSVHELSQKFNNDESSAFDWLNEVGEFILSEDSNLPLLEKNAIFPNENGTFKTYSKVYSDLINDQNLIEILQLLGEDWNDILLHHNVGFGYYNEKKKIDIAVKINEKLKNISNKDQNFIKSISLLSEWFDNNPEEGKELFTETYRKRAELFMNTIDDKDSLYKVMRSKTDLSHLSKVAEAIEENPRLFENIEHAKEIYSLLKQYNINDIDQLRNLLSNEANEVHVPNLLLPVTQEIILNMGISSIEEWENALKDKDLKMLFSHKSTPTTDMFVYAQSLIKKAKKNIVNYLKTLDNYNIDHLDDSTAPTILAGILKNDVPISIVARPAYNGEVIIYYGSELDILDYEASELWIDDDIKPKVISLGHLLKKAQIVKFPV